MDTHISLLALEGENNYTNEPQVDVKLTFIKPPLNNLFLIAQNAKLLANQNENYIEMFVEAQWRFNGGSMEVQWESNGSPVEVFLGVTVKHSDFIQRIKISWITDVGSMES